MYVQSLELGPPTSSPASECAPPPPGTKGEGVGESLFQRLEKKLGTLSTLWSYPSTGLPDWNPSPCQQCPVVSVEPQTWAPAESKYKFVIPCFLTELET